MENLAMLYHGNSEDLHPAHRGFAESIEADILSVSEVSPHSAKSFYQEFKRGHSIGKYDTIIAEGSRTLYSGFIHKMRYNSNLVYLCADHRLHNLWNNSIEVNSLYSLSKNLIGTYGKPVVRAIAQHGIDGIIAISEFVQDYLHPIFQNHVPISIAHPYIQPGLYERLARLDPDLNKNIVVTVGRPTWYKGVDLLVDAWSKVRENHPKAELHIVGKSHPESYSDTKGVTVRGFVEDLTSVYESASLYVQPSRIEPFGVAVLEALRAGLPAVVTNTTGARSEIAELDDRLITSATSNELAEAVDWYFDTSRKKRNKLSDVAKYRGKQFGPCERKRIFQEKFENLLKMIE